MSTPTPDEVRWLVSPEATRLLAQYAAEPPDPFHLAQRHVRWQAALLAEQLELRRRAAVKFTQAAHMFFTRQSLEQATEAQIAAYKAHRFPADVSIGDLCTGMGGDLIALAEKAGAVTSWELDPGMSLLAQANLAACVPHRVAVCRWHTTDAAQADVGQLWGWHIDPDRRAGGTRSTHLQHCQPHQAELETLLSRCSNAAIKLAPATELPKHWSQQAETEWISTRRECRQQVVWFGQLATQPGYRRATRLHPQMPPATYLGQPAPWPAVAETLGPLLFEPDPAILAADLTGSQAAAYGWHPLAAETAYFTGPAPPANSLCSTFQVRDLLPLDIKKLRKYLHAANIGQVEIKKRGVHITPEQLRQKLSLRGPHFAVLILLVWLGHSRVVVADRVEEKPL